MKTLLKLPFEAVVSEYQERGSLQADEWISVLSFEYVEDLNSVLVNIKAGRNS